MEMGICISVPGRVVSNKFSRLMFGGNTVIWFDYLENVSKDGSNLVHRWDDKSGLAHHLLQATGTNQMLWRASGVLGDGIDNFMKCVAFTWVKPEFIYMVVRQVTWTNIDYLFDGGANNTGVIYQGASTPGIRATAGTASAQNNNLAVDTWGIIRVLFNDAASKLIVNNTAPTIWNCGAGNMGGFTLGSRSDGLYVLNIEVKEIIGRNIADNATDEAAIYNYLSAKYGI